MSPISARPSPESVDCWGTLRQRRALRRHWRRLILALSELAIEDTGDTGRGGALLQQQLRQLASEAGLTVVGSEVKEPEALDALSQIECDLAVNGRPR